MTDINTYLNTPEVQSIIHYWNNRYSKNCTRYIKEELLSEAYLGAWETILKYPTTPFRELLTLISLGIKWKLCNYINNNIKHNTLQYIEHIDIKGYSNTIEDTLYLKGILNQLQPRNKLILTMTYEGYTQVEISQVLNISKQRVNQLVHTIKYRLPTP